MTGAVWEEPVQGELFPREWLGLSGIDQLRLFLSGHVGLPPIGRLTGMHLTELGVGSATFVMPITGWLQSPQGLMTAGAVAILADGPLGCAIQTTLQPATGYTTTELSMNMVRPAPRSGNLIGRGRIVHVGRQMGLSEVFVTDDGGRLIAHGTSRCAIFPPAADAPPPPSELPAPTVAQEQAAAPFARPVVGAVLGEEEFQTRSGLEVMEGLASGELPPPPATHLLRVRPTVATEGMCEFSMPATGWLASPSGVVEGGVTAFLTDNTLGAAMQTTVPAGTAIAPTDLRVQFLRPVATDGALLTARASVLHRGRSFAAARASHERTGQARRPRRCVGSHPPQSTSRPARWTTAWLSPHPPRSALPPSEQPDATHSDAHRLPDPLPDCSAQNDAWRCGPSAPEPAIRAAVPTSATCSRSAVSQVVRRRAHLRSRQSISHRRAR